MVLAGNAWMRTRADKSAVGAINRPLRFSRIERMHHYNGEELRRDPIVTSATVASTR